MIDREKVINGLECCTNGEGKFCFSDCPYFGEVPMTDGRCITAVQADALALLKEQEADKWISVTERLPEVRNAVLCYSPHHNNIWALSLHEDGEWYYWIPRYQKYNPDFEGPITHWMPLPDQPKNRR